MSVLYKALQKAEKENELRQSEADFDPRRLAASGALKAAGGRGRIVNRLVTAAIVLVAVGGGAAFLVFKDSLMPVPATPVATAPASVAPSPSAPSTPAQAASGDEPQPQEPASPSTEAAPSVSTTDAPVEAPPAETQVAAAPVPAKPVPPKAEISKPAPPGERGMPTIAESSPARMLSPPISVRRSEFDLAGVGDQVQVREVSKSARSNVAAGYEALIRGSYDTALGFYDEALKEEPNSVLALLGRGAALQKLGRGQEAQSAYEQVLKLDPQSREALTNMTVVIGERAPQDALTRLLELEREYAVFSPIKAQIGLAYAKMGSLPQALDYFRRALALSPETVMYHYNMALVLDHMGRREQAVASYERVLASISAGRSPPDLSGPEIERRVRFLQAR